MSAQAVCSRADLAHEASWDVSIACTRCDFSCQRRLRDDAVAQGYGDGMPGPADWYAFVGTGLFSVLESGSVKPPAPVRLTPGRDLEDRLAA